MPIFIKNMVCKRCIMAVEAILQAMGINYTNISLGEVDLAIELTEQQRQELDTKLRAIGFELIDDRKSRLIAQIKNAVIAWVYALPNEHKTNLSDYLSEKLHYEYSYLSNTFSEAEGVTIEHYYIAQKIERVKELLTYDELSLSQIADKLGYSSVAHLSNQFKKVSGQTPTQYKTDKAQNRKPLDEI